MHGALQARRAVVTAQRVQQVLQGYARSLVILSVARDTDQCRDSLRLIGSCVASERGGALVVVMGCAEVLGVFCVSSSGEQNAEARLVIRRAGELLFVIAGWTGRPLRDIAVTHSGKDVDAMLRNYPQR